MGVDPLAVACQGYFTSQYENNYPLTVAHFGYIVAGGALGGMHRYSRDNINDLLEWRRKNNESVTVEKQGKQVEIDRIPVVKTKRLPIDINAKPLSEITEDLDRQLASELRWNLIQEHQKLVLQEIKENRETDEDIALIIILSDV